jgi:hypothetical protein
MYIRCSDELHRQHVPKTTLDMFMHKEINFLGASCHAITRKVKALPRLLAKLPRLPWKQ